MIGLPEYWPDHMFDGETRWWAANTSSERRTPAARTLDPCGRARGESLESVKEIYRSRTYLQTTEAVGNESMDERRTGSIPDGT